MSPIKSNVKSVKSILLNSVFWNNKKRVTAGLVDFDNLLLNVKVITRVQGQFVIIRLNIPKSITIFQLKIKVTTFNKLFNKLKRIADDVNAESRVS